MASQHYQSHSCVPAVCTGFAQGSKKSKQQSRYIMFRVILCIQFYRLMQLIFSTSLKGIIRKECQSFTNHGHDITPPAVFNPLSLWLTLPRDMGVSHTLWPSSITGAILACLWFAQGLHSREITEACSFHLCYYQLEPVGSITSRQAYGAGMPAILIICRW